MGVSNNGAISFKMKHQRLTVGLTTAPLATPIPVRPVAAPKAGPVASPSPAHVANLGVKVLGDLRTWHKITLAFLHGPFTSEDAALNPFTDYRLDVVF